MFVLTLSWLWVSWSQCHWLKRPSWPQSQAGPLPVHLLITSSCSFLSYHPTQFVIILFTCLFVYLLSIAPTGRAETLFVPIFPSTQHSPWHTVDIRLKCAEWVNMWINYRIEWVKCHKRNWEELHGCERWGKASWQRWRFRQALKDSRDVDTDGAG